MNWNNAMVIMQKMLHGIAFYTSETCIVCTVVVYTTHCRIASKYSIHIV